MKKSIIILLHIGYWALYFLLIATLMLAMSNHSKGFSLTILPRLIFLSPLGLIAFIPGGVGFYIFYSVLFERFLSKRKIGLLLFWGLLTIIVAGALPILLLRMKINPEWGVTNNWAEILTMITFLTLLAMVHGIIGLVMKGFIVWYGDIRLKEELKRKNYEVELALIKAQINPHFLFNTINNIDVLIEKDPVMASAYLNKLSGIMRFMLYDTRAPQIPLSQELSYIEKYIDLQRIRSSKSDFVQFEVDGEAGNTMIEPMLFIPFIENAFKHAELRKDSNAINIRFTIAAGQIRFHCENRYANGGQQDTAYSGLGNELIRRRLELQYPGHHVLAVNKKDGVYIVDLSIHLHEN